MKRTFKKFNFIVAVLAVVCLILPTVITVSLLKRNDAANKQISAIETKETASGKRVADKQGSLFLQSTELSKVLTEEPSSAEMDTTEPSPLLMNGNASQSDADAATETDAEVAVSNGKKVYLTFDDGPSDHTEELLDILDKENVKATFFIVAGERDHAKELKDIYNAGHTIGLHSDTHIYSEIYADLDSFKADVKGVHDWVESVIGVDARYYRFPGGSSNAVSNVSMSDCIKYIHDSGYEYFDWNALSMDAENVYLTAEQLNNNVMSYVRNNEGDSIVLMHDLDDNYHTVEALPDLIHTLKQEGYEFAVIDDSTEPVQHYTLD